jgi:hypothetical protein
MSTDVVNCQIKDEAQSMTETIILASAWLITIVALILLVPKARLREAWVLGSFYE